jgi:hypothetical protein
VNPLVYSQLLMSNCVLDKKSLHSSGPCSFHITWIIPPEVFPIVPFVKMPHINYPFFIIMFTSLADAHLLLSGINTISLTLLFSSCFFSLYLLMLISGMINENSYFPVHRGFGLMITGCGRVPVYLIHINKFITMSISIKVSFKVKSITPSNASYTIPMTGLLL